jgi:ubiquinone/menaquinone biosynthesis C-methylase UbiE
MSHFEEIKLIIEKSPPRFSNAYRNLYLERRKNNISNLPNFRRWLKATSELLKVDKETKILDIGCGFGFHLIEFAAIGYDCVGLEITKEFAKIAKIIAVNFGLRLEMVIGDACNIPFKDNSFNAVFSNEFFSHVKDINIALRQQLHILKKGGRILIRDSNLLCPLTIFDLLIRYPLRTKGKFGGLKWLLNRHTCIKNIYGRGFEGKDENIKTLGWWKKTIGKHKNIRLELATTSYAYRHAGIVSKIFESFLGQIILSGEKM